MTQHDFSTYNKRVDLAARGIFSIDQPAYRAKRQREAEAQRQLDDAYTTITLDRQAEYRRIAAEMEAQMTSGIWARSTGEFPRRCRALDEAVLERAARHRSCYGWTS